MVIRSCKITMTFILFINVGNNDHHKTVMLSQAPPAPPPTLCSGGQRLSCFVSDWLIFMYLSSWYTNVFTLCWWVNSACLLMYFLQGFEQCLPIKVFSPRLCGRTRSIHRLFNCASTFGRHSYLRWIRYSVFTLLYCQTVLVIFNAHNS